MWGLINEVGHISEPIIQSSLNMLIIRLALVSFEDVF